ncbi:MAG: Flp pilus assembly protein CpaB [Bacillota bacterium]
MRQKLFLLFALFFAVGAALSAYFYLESVKQSYREAGKYVTVVVAGTDIPARTAITAAMIRYADVPEEYVHPAAARSAREVLGKIALTEITAGEAVLKNKLVAEKDVRYGLAFSLAAGERAVTVAVNEVSGVGRMVRPGDRVDVIATFDVAPPDPQQPKTTYTSTIIHNIRVLATGQTLAAAREAKDNKGSGFETVTLAVTPAQAQVLVLASERGSIRLVLRSPVDEGMIKLPPTKLSDLVNVAPAVKTPVAQRPAAKTPANK